MSDVDKLFSNFRPGAFSQDYNSIPQDIAAGNGNIAPSGWLEDDSVTSDVIRASAVVADKISAGAVETDKLAANAVTAAKIAANTITANEIAANAVTANEIAADTITANEIASNAITASEIAANAVTTTKILAANVTASRMEATISGKNFGANDGSASAPGFFFDSDSNTGLYRVASFPILGAVIALAINGNFGFALSALGHQTSVRIEPDSDNALDLGTTSHRWRTVYSAGGVVTTSDASHKQDIADAPLGLDFVKSLKPRVYRWRDTSDTQLQEQAEREYDPEALALEVEPWELRIAAARRRQAALPADHPDMARLDFVVATSRARAQEIREAHQAPLRAAQQARRPGRRQHYGLIAQEVKESLDAAGVDAGFWQQSPDGLQSLSYQELLVPLIRAVQELAAQVEELKGSR